MCDVKAGIEMLRQDLRTKVGVYVGVQYYVVDVESGYTQPIAYVGGDDS